MISEHMYMIWYSYGRHKVNAWRKCKLYMDIRVGLFIVSIDHKYFV